MIRVFAALILWLGKKCHQLVVRPALAAVLVLASVCIAAPLRAGTTGSLTGTLNDASGAPLVGAKLTVVSPSQSATTLSDGSGRFTFLSLAPDTYTLSGELQGYDTVSISGITIFADQSQRLTLKTARRLQTIGKVTTRAGDSLVRSGTTADVYSVNAAAASKAAVLGGGGNLNTAYSAIASVPGAYVPTNQSGAYQNVMIRGGDYAQVGYEFDGVPTNKAFDNYPANTLSSLGQQEVQIYTGPPVNAEASGSSGFINQVVRTGTYPGFEDFDLGIGGSQYYHHGTVEFGGATTNRNFSYYVGLSGYDQEFRYYDQFNGASQSNLWGPPLVAAPCPATNKASYASCYASGYGPGGYVLGPYNAGQPAHISDRENIVNLHFAIPHKGGALKDDIQLLYDTGAMVTSSYNSVNDWGGASTFSNNGLAFPSLPAGLEYGGTIGAPLANNYQQLVTTHSYPHSTQLPNADIGYTDRDTQRNSQAILKAQYQHNFSQSAYLRLYAYSSYSDRFLYAPFEYNLPLGDAAGYQNISAPDYEVVTHTRGLSGTFADQISSHHLLNVLGSVTTATSLRDNNSSFGNGGRTLALVVNGNDPTSGICYSVAAAVAAPATCSTATSLSFSQAQAGQAMNLNGVTCGTGPCRYFAVENGLHGSYNQVNPVFLASAITDSWRPTDKLTLNLALRYNSYQYDGADTNGPARAFWFNAWNTSKCVSTAPASSPVDKSALGIAVTAPCSAAGADFVPATLQNVSSPVYRFGLLEPRVGMTYANHPNDVYRFSFGKYSQPSAAAFAQYNRKEQDLPDFIGSEFYKYGYDQPGHVVPPDITYNFDASWEHQFAGSDVSFKVTPFYRRDFNENQGFYLNAAQGFSSGLPIALSSIRGIELAVRKGDFSRNGLAAQLAYTYTYSTVRYEKLSNGTTPITPINKDIQTYNAYTSFCATNPKDARCGTTTGGVKAAPCYVATENAGKIDGAAPAACTAPGAYANPYWNAPAQALLDEGGIYFPTDPIVSGVTLQANSYNVPHVASLILNYKHDRFAITPTLQFSGGQRYGVPESVVGVDPGAGCRPLGTSTAGDPRYPYGSPAGAAYDATTCPGALNAIPDPYTGKFDSVGAFVAPSQLLANMQMSYQVSKKLTVSLALTNLVNQCFGGSKEPWTGLANPKTCSYNSGGAIGSVYPSANFYNPGATRQAFLMPYTPQFGQYVLNNGYSAPSSPFNVFATAQLKI